MLVIYVLSTIIFILLLVLWYFYYQLQRVKKLHEQLTFDNHSMRVLHGKHWEHFVPFMETFEKIGNRRNFVFLGMPIDGVIFDDDAIKFIEIKTGQGKLSKKQQHIKNLVEKKYVQWHELRFEQK